MNLTPLSNCMAIPYLTYPTYMARRHGKTLEAMFWKFPNTRKIHKARKCIRSHALVILCLDFLEIPAEIFLFSLAYKVPVQKIFIVFKRYFLQTSTVS